MNISTNTSINNSPSFKSLANPVKPFKIKTSLGNLSVEEITYKNLKKDSFANDIISFCYRNFASNTEDSFWLTYFDPTKKELWKNFITRDSNNLAERIRSKDKNLTVLVAKDKHNKIQGVCTSFGMEEIPNCQKDVCYIECLAVNPEYRGQNIGRILVEKTFESAKNAFTDIFLTGEKMARGFYDKLGFKELNIHDPNQKILIDKIARIRQDYPDYISLMTKALQADKPRWYDNPIHRSR